MALHAVTDRPPRAVAYIRVSQEREDMISPELQETAIRDHCLRSGYELGEIITDLDLSGRFWKRRQVERAIGMIESGEAQVIVVWKMSRVARNRLDWNIALDRVETVGGRLESATEPIDTTTSSGRFSRGILAELAAFESERAGEQWQETHRRRWRRGLPHSGRARLGYVYARDVGFTPDPETAPIVREMFERYNGGQGLRSIADWLVDLGVSGITTGRGVSYYMRSGFAAGYIDHHNPECVGPHRSGQPCGNMVRERGAHEPLVDAETFAAFEVEQARRATLPARLVSPVSTLSGVVFCTACRKRMARHASKVNGASFRCTTRGCAAPTTVAERRAEQLVIDWLPTVAGLVSEAAQQEHLGQSTVALEQERLERIAASAEQALGKLTVDFARSLIPEGAYAAARLALEAERDEAARAARDIRRSSASLAQHEALAVDLLAAWREMEPAERNVIVRELCVVLVTKGGSRPTAVVRGLWELS